MISAGDLKNKMNELIDVDLINKIYEDMLAQADNYLRNLINQEMPKKSATLIIGPDDDINSNRVMVKLSTTLSTYGYLVSETVVPAYQKIGDKFVEHKMLALKLYF